MAWLVPPFYRIGIFKWLLILISWFAVYLARSVIVRDYPLSNFAFWAQLMAASFICALINEITILATIFLNPDKVGHIFIDVGFPPGSFLHTYSLPLTVAVIAFSTMTHVPVLIKHILFFDFPALRSGLWMAYILLVSSAVNMANVLPDRFTISREEGKRFWTSLMGENSQTAIFAGFILGFIVNEIINLRLRQNGLNEKMFKETVNISFMIVLVPIFISMFISGYITNWIGQKGNIFVFVPIALLWELQLFYALLSHDTTSNTS